MLPDIGVSLEPGFLWLLSFRDPYEEKLTEQFLEEEGIEESRRVKIAGIIKGMGTLDINYLLSLV